jgi:hypothetical protein
VFWSGRLAALLLTALLLIRHLPFSPLSTLDATATEAAVVFLMAMAVRWVLLAGMIVAIAWL